MPSAACARARAAARNLPAPVWSRNIGPDSLFVNVGERTNVTGSAAFKLVLNSEYDKPSGRAPAGGKRRAGDRRQHGRAM